MKALQIISIALGVLVTLPTAGTIAFTFFKYSEAIFEIAERCSNMDCMADYDALKKRVEELENKQ